MKLSFSTATQAIGSLFICALLSVNPAFAQTFSSASSETYQQTQDTHPLDNEGAGAVMGQGVKNAQQNQRTRLGHFSSLASTSFPTDGTLGMDVSSYQANINWSNQVDQGARFAYIKASEGTYYTSKSFSSQYLGATDAGMIRGAYHFAIPADSDGATQAKYFVEHGGGWSADGQTLPGLLDIEYNPYHEYGNACFNMSASQINAWISDFATTYNSLTGRYPAIYTAKYWWDQCTGNTSQFSYLPLHIATYQSSPGTMPAGWTTYDIWQYTDQGPFDGDSDIFNGSQEDLTLFARNPLYIPLGSASSQSYKSFSDVPESRVFYHEISWVAKLGITRGWSDGTFRPDENVTRAQMAAFVYRMAGSPVYQAPATSPFKDVSAGDPFYKEISWMASKGIAKGWDDGTFRPDNAVNRDAMAAFLYRLSGEDAGSSTLNFSDVPSDHPFYKAIAWMANKKITTGWSDGTFRPYEPIKRDAMMAFIYRYLHRS